MALSLLTSDSQALSQAISVSRQYATSLSRDTTYIGLASLLPQEYQALCSCAGLFFVRLGDTCAGDDLSRVEVAALDRYFFADEKTQKRHIRAIFLSAEESVQLLEYDRRLASMATCDVRELIESHVMRVEGEAAPLSQPEMPVQEARAVPDHLGETVQTPTPRASGKKPEKVLSLDGPTVIIPREAIQSAWSRMKHYPCHVPSIKDFHLLMLRAALSVAEHSAGDRALIRQALVWRDRVSPQMEVTPIYARGRTDQIVEYRVKVSVPQVFAA